MALDADVLRSIADEIDQVFGDLPQPGDDELLHPDCMDDVDVAPFYGELARTDVTDTMVVTNYAALTGFSAKAFRYYLPAYLHWTLRNLDSCEYAGESTLIALDPATDKEMLHEFRKSKFALFDKSQIAAVERFLWAVSEHPDLGEFAQDALANYWMEAKELSHDA